MAISKKQTAELYLFELVERTTRFYIHLNHINRQFYSEEDSKVDDKLIFLQSYKNSLLEVLSICTGISYVLSLDDLQDDVIEKSMLNIRESFRSINVLHQEYLVHLPRPMEPIELRRFGRIIDKHVFKLNDERASVEQQKQISIYISETLGDSVFAKDPLSRFQSEHIAKNLLKVKGDIQGIILPFERAVDSGEDNIHHITIPRIDTHNPCRWPTMIHELGHKIMHEDFFKGDTIEVDFRNSLDDEQSQFVNNTTTEKNINLYSWLIECWCDLFACVVFGPAFWFSQYLSFIFETEDTSGAKYPLPLFRLRLIYNILSHRFPKALFEEMKETMSECESVLEYFDQQSERSFSKDDDFRELFMYFKEFFRTYFSKSEEQNVSFGTEILNSKLSPLIKYTEDIQEATIRDLELSLSIDLPVPSLSYKGNSITQRPTYVQEIIAAGWYFRNNKLKNNVLNELNSLNSSTLEDFAVSYESGILKLFSRFDQSILRSIQVSEWFDLFYNVDSNEDLLLLEAELSRASESSGEPSYQLADIDIFRLLKQNELKIIPIMNLREQLGCASLDLRLGTSFQFYYQNKYGVIDFSDKKSLQNAEFNSNLIDIDYLDFIILSPGQFILGHTMEYVKLPENVAAEIEGRSSFARLGIEIHMTAGFIDPGFEGVVTLEIHNAGPTPVKLFPGVRIAQLKFIPVNKPYNPYNKRHDAKYKGLLSHHTSMQFKDYEIQKIKDALDSKDLPS